jgi:hypothetical protein
LIKDPNVGVVLPRIPGKSPEDISYSDDISTIGAQCGLLITERPRTTNESIGSILLMREKLIQLEEANEKTAGLCVQVLGI